MSKFNRTTKPRAEKATINEAGGSAFTLTPEMELAGIAWTSFVEDEFYRSQTDTIDRLQELVAQCAPTFVADVAHVTRHRIGLRSISHVMTAMLSADKRATGSKWLRPWVKEMLRRPDDMLEILAYLKQTGKKPGNALLRGFADKLSTLSEWQLAKWNKGSGKKLWDVVNIAHPKATPALGKLMHNTLPPPASGETVNWKDKDAIAEALEGDTLGYLAVLYHLRSVIDVAPELVRTVCKRLTTRTDIRRAGIFPYQYLRAYKALTENPQTQGVLILSALQRASRISLENVPKLDGKIAVLLDHSGSMMGREFETCGMLASACALANMADLFVFETSCQRVRYDPTLDPIQLYDRLEGMHWGGTSITAAFAKLRDQYDYVFLFTDEEHWYDGGYFGNNGQEALVDYKRRSGADPFVFALNPSTYGTTQFNGPRCVHAHGVSNHVFQIAEWFATKGHDVKKLAMEQADWRS